MVQGIERNKRGGRRLNIDTCFPKQKENKMNCYHPNLSSALILSGKTIRFHLLTADSKILVLFHISMVHVTEKLD